MGSELDKLKHSDRIRKKRQVKAASGIKAERTRNVIAKELIIPGKSNPRVIRDKRGKTHDLDKMSFHQLVEAIKEDT